MKDLATKKMMTVNVTAKSEIHNLPLQMATRVAAQTNGGGQSGGRGGRGRRRRGGGEVALRDKVRDKGTRRAHGALLERTCRR